MNLLVSACLEVFVSILRELKRDCTVSAFRSPFKISERLSDLPRIEGVHLKSKKNDLQFDFLVARCLGTNNTTSNRL